MSKIERLYTSDNYESYWKMFFFSFLISPLQFDYIPILYYIISVIACFFVFKIRHKKRNPRNTDDDDDDDDEQKKSK